MADLSSFSTAHARPGLMMSTPIRLLCYSLCKETVLDIKQVGFSELFPSEQHKWR